MTVGLEQFRDEQQADRLHWMLLLPFLGRVGDYPVNRRGRKDGTPRADESPAAAPAGGETRRGKSPVEER